MFERFSDGARRVLVLAQEEARLLIHSFIGTEHILLGLLHEGDGLGAKALQSLGIKLEDVREKVEETIGPAGTAPTGSPPFTPRAKKVLELSLREALQLGHNYIGTEHLLLGIVREGEGAAAQVLVNLGADLSRVRQQVIQLLSGTQGSAEAPGAGYSTQAVTGMRGGTDSSASGAGTVEVGRGVAHTSGRWVLAASGSGRAASDYAQAFRELEGWLAERGMSLDAFDPADIAIVSVDRPPQPGFELLVWKDALEAP